jgi:hypothetical protein
MRHAIREVLSANLGVGCTEIFSVVFLSRPGKYCIMFGLGNNDPLTYPFPSLFTRHPVVRCTSGCAADKAVFNENHLSHI